MNLKLEKKTVLVTGGSKGIGADITKAFILENADVVITARSNPEEALRYAQSLNAMGKGKAAVVNGDISNQRDVADWFDVSEELFGRPVSILVNNAAPLQMENKEIKDMELGFFHQYMMPGVLGLFYVTQEFVQRLQAADETGSIINVVSKAGIMPTSGGQAPYSSMKGAMHGMTRYLAQELSRYHIQVNEVVPGFVMNSKFREMMEKDPDRWAQYEKQAQERSYIGHFLEGYYLGAASAFLASEQTLCTIGTSFDVSGGRLV